MTFPADRPEPPRHPRRLPAAELERNALGVLRREPSRRVGLLAIGLGRSDRVRALAQRSDALTVLGEVCDRIESALRPMDRYAVVAVDEVWVMLADAPNEAIVRLAAASLRDRLAEPVRVPGERGEELHARFEPAFGGAWMDQEGAAAALLLAVVASRALLEAQGAEDRIVVAALSTDRERQMRAQLQPRVRRALEANELQLWYQPQIELSPRRCTSFEALLRWPQPAGEAPVSPALVVSICEEIGLINELTRFNVNTVLRHQMGWQMRGEAPRVSVNLSALTLSDSNFPSFVAQACETWGLPPSRLLFELTESAIARHETETIEFMNQLRALGCALAIDDFGTGYSSFAYLRRFPIDELKIDQVFVRHLASDAADRRIVKVLVEIAHAFGLVALAEGVEDTGALQVLAEHGCDAVQGWLFAKAMPADQALAWRERFNAQQAAGAAAALPTA